MKVVVGLVGWFGEVRERRVRAPPLCWLFTLEGTPFELCFWFENFCLIMHLYCFYVKRELAS